MKTFFYSGTFDPFTALDAEIVFNTLKEHLGSKVVIGLETDAEKPSLFSTAKRMDMIEKSIRWYAKKLSFNSSVDYLKDIKVVCYHGLPIYEALKHNATQFLVPQTDLANPKCNAKYTLSRQIARNILSYQIGCCFYKVNYLPEEITESIKLCYKNHEYIMLAYFVTPPAHNTMMEDLLEKEYFECCRQSGISWQKFCEEMSTRAYHNLSHIAYMLNLYRLRTSTDFLNDRMFKGAIFFHDYVSDSEAKSFEVSKLSESARGLFMATRRPGKHLSELTADERLIHDLDLAILADKVLYENYAYCIRMEYADVAHNDYVEGRTQILEELQKEIVKRTAFTEKEKETAIKNIQQEIQYLKTGDYPTE